MPSVSDLEKYGIEEFMIREIPIGRPELTLTCIDGIDNDRLKVGLSLEAQKKI